jgi:hypothetical protein
VEEILKYLKSIPLAPGQERDIDGALKEARQYFREKACWRLKKEKLQL